MNKKIYLDNLILSAKTGNKEAISKLKSMFSSLCDGIYKDLCIKYPVLKSNKFHVYHHFYIALWEAINEYHFFKGKPFGMILLDKMVGKIVIFAGDTPSIDKVNSVMSSFRRDKPSKNRELAKRILKTLTYKRQLAMMYYLYIGGTREAGWNLMKLKGHVFEKRILSAYKRIREDIADEKKRKEDVGPEKVYKIKESKIV